MSSVLVEAKKLYRPEPEARTWPPLEAVARLQIRSLRVGLLDRLKHLTIDMHKPREEVVNLVIEAGLDALEKAISEANS